MENIEHSNEYSNTHYYAHGISLHALLSSKEELNKLYWGNPPISAHQLAKDFGTTHNVIIYRLRKYGISIRHCHSGKVSPKNIDIEQVKKMYIDKGMVLKEIAKELNVNWELVRKYLKRAGVVMKAKHARIRSTCKEPGCNNPVHKVWHAIYKKFYGTRCQYHHKRHYTLLNRYRQRRVNFITPDKYKPWRFKYPEAIVSLKPLAPWVTPTFELTFLKCKHKACPYPPVNNDLCKKHFLETTWESSIVGCSTARCMETV